MNGFIAVAIAHDSTCEPGDEWLFHGMAQPYDAFGDGKSTIDTKDDKNLLDKDMEELRLREAKEQEDDDFNSFGCIMAIGFVVFLVGVAIWAIW
jgi:hypothetical protein